MIGYARADKGPRNQRWKGFWASDWTVDCSSSLTKSQRCRCGIQKWHMTVSIVHLNPVFGLYGSTHPSCNPTPGHWIKSFSKEVWTLQGNGEKPWIIIVRRVQFHTIFRRSLVNFSWMENQMSSLCKIEKGGTQTSELHHAKPTTDFQINWFDFRCHKYEDKH